MNRLDLENQIRAALEGHDDGIERPDAAHQAPTTGRPIALNDDAALARIIGGTLNQNNL